jgi:CHAT domain-containing protein
MKCADIDLKLFGDASGYFVEVLSSPHGRTEPHPLRLPSDLEEQISRARSREGDRISNAQLGVALFAALLPRPIRSVYHLCKGSVGDTGILRLRLDIRADELTCIPWEMLRDDQDYLAMSPRFPVLRYLHRAAPTPFKSMPKKVKILLVTATPVDASPLPGVKKELGLVCDSLKKLGASAPVEVSVLENASFDLLRSRLDGSFNVLHFMGHGAFEDNRGYLIFEDAAHQSSWQEAESVGDVLRDKNVELLVLNACETAVPSPEESLIGVAHAAHAAGIPAVIAMQQAILDSAASAFAAAFYDTLAKGQPLETCLAAGRVATKNELGNDSTDWAIPVLFSNAFSRSVL